jgi:hypothetical protein
MDAEITDSVNQPVLNCSIILVAAEAGYQRSGNQRPNW